LSKYGNGYEKIPECVTPGTMWYPKHPRVQKWLLQLESTPNHDLFEKTAGFFTISIHPLRKMASSKVPGRQQNRTDFNAQLNPPETWGNPKNNKHQEIRPTS